MNNTKRIEFIDLAKGVCILFVVMMHCNINLPYAAYIRMPLYFILSGLFFKQYGGGFDFFIKKTNKIFIPFISFFLFSYIIYLFLSVIQPNLRINSQVEQFSLLDPFYSRICINNPLWFLLSLFCSNIIFYFINTIIRNIYNQFFLIIILGGVGAYLNHAGIILPIYLNKTLAFLPFFYFGRCIKHIGILYEKNSVKNDILLFVFFLLIFFLFADDNLYLVDFQYLYNYLICLVGVLALLLLLKFVKKLPLVSYYGRYSIIVLCTHYWVFNAFELFVPNIFNLQDRGLTNVIVFLLTMFVEYFVIKFCLAYLPKFTAQEDFIKTSWFNSAIKWIK